MHQPLGQLQQIADKLKAGEYDARTQRPLRVPEFRHLADTFERLARELQLRQSADLEAQKHLKIARDEALAARPVEDGFYRFRESRPAATVKYDDADGNGAQGQAARPHLLPLVERLERAAAKQTDLVNALLDISQLDAGLIRPVFRDLEVSSVWEQAIEDFVDVADAKQLRIVAEPCNETIRSDP